MTPRIREKTSFETPKTRTETIHTQPKGKAKLEHEELSDEAPKDFDQKLVRAVQRYQKEQKKDYGSNDASPPSEKILAETFSTKFKLPSLDKYDRTVDPRSHLTIFRTMMQLQDINNFVLCRVFPSTLTGLVEKLYQHLSLGSIHSFT